MCARAHWYWFGTLFRDNGLHKLVFNVLLDGTEVAYYVDGQVVRQAKSYLLILFNSSCTFFGLYFTFYDAEKG